MAIGTDFVAGGLRDGLVLNYASEREMIQRFAGPLPERGRPIDGLLDELAEVAHWSVAQSDPRYLAFPDSGSSVAAALASIVSTFLNQNLITFDRGAPAASVIELQLIGWLRELVGYPTRPLTEYDGLRGVGAMWTSGGNMSNHVAIATALAARWPQVHREGVRGLPERPVIVLARQVEHFSYRAAAQVLGLGSDALVWSAAAPNHTSDVAALAAALADPPDGARPFMVVGVAGNCRTTGIDDLAAIADVCAEHDVWFHVDACHGGSLLFSERLRGRLTGIERADSVSLDPHKGLFVTYPSSYLLVRDPADLARFARYPEKLNDPDCLDLGLITPFYGSRGFESLRLWALITHLGRAGVAALVERRQHTFEEMSQLLRDTGMFRFVGDSDFYRCAFVFCPRPAGELLEQLSARRETRPPLRAIVSKYTRAYAEELYRSGAVVFDLFALEDLADRLGLGTTDKFDVMGMCVGHPDIDDATRQQITEHLVATGEKLMPAMLAELRLLGDGEAADDSCLVLGPAGW
ncbi:pyridoxal phosphate-dependent decarboxylase family protein [Phytohabitans houttuyneae]|uniref:Pyridoxal-dependent decarboxylase n=1 Tax=Phytohabitans houttuyneae TaxID=1076126 RepID=A0A6V8JZ17_9ACTN|nr:pyridoxal-dependent decarboxylase [Phytohabitans houttuyneae]GFJ78033.1 hypothetical protein Phou_022130 [Phytohabitans houttuyneae]